MSRICSLSLCALIAGCQAAAPQAWQPPRDVEDAEALAGLRAAQALESCYGGVDRDPVAERRMARVAERLSGAMPHGLMVCRCRVLRCLKVNAFSLPGGLIYVTRGLLVHLDTDDRLAAAIAHELAHIEAKDSFKPTCVPPQEKLAREIAADRRAITYLSKAGYRPEGLIDVLGVIDDVMPDPSWGPQRRDVVTSEIARLPVTLARMGDRP